MELKKIKCDNCGATMEIDKDLDTFTCKYCNSKIFIDDAGTKVNRVLKAFTNASERFQEQNLNYQKKQTDYLNSDEYQQNVKRVLTYAKYMGLGLCICSIFLIIIMLISK